MGSGKYLFAFQEVLDPLDLEAQYKVLMRFGVWSILLSRYQLLSGDSIMPGGYVTTVYIVTLLLLRTEGTENRGNITISR